MDNSERVMNYFSCEEFLDSLYHSRHKRNPAYSMRKFSRDLGFSSSSHLSDVIRGKKKLGIRGRESVMDHLQMNPVERAWFQLINDRSGKQSAQIGDTLSGFINLPAVWLHRTRPMLRDLSWEERRTCTVILALFQVFSSEFRNDPLWICRRSGIRLQEARVRSCLNLLHKRKLLTRDPSPASVAEQPQDDHQIQSDSSEKLYCYKLLAESGEAMQAKHNQCQFRNETYLISREDYTILKMKIEEFQNRLHSWASFKAVLPGNAVGVSFNTQLYPITFPDTEMQSSPAKKK